MVLKRPRLHFRLSFYAIQSKQTKTLSQGYDGRGHVEFERTEWGIGKGKWKRELREIAKSLQLKGNVKPIYFIIGSRYTGRYEGPSHLVESLYEAI